MQPSRKQVMVIRNRELKTNTGYCNYVHAHNADANRRRFFVIPFLFVAVAAKIPYK